MPSAPQSAPDTCRYRRRHRHDAVTMLSNGGSSPLARVRRLLPLRVRPLITRSSVTFCLLIAVAATTLLALLTRTTPSSPALSFSSSSSFASFSFGFSSAASSFASSRWRADFQKGLDNLSPDARIRRLEHALARGILTQDAVTHVVDEMVQRVAGIARASAARALDESDLFDGDASTSPSDLLRFLFGSISPDVAGAVGDDVRDLRLLVEEPILPLSLGDDSAATIGPPRPFNLSAPNLREKMTMLYISAMQPASTSRLTLLTGIDALSSAERVFYAAPAPLPDDPPTVDRASSSQVVVPPFSLLLRRELTQWRSDPVAYEEWALSLDLHLDLDAVSRVAEAEEAQDERAATEVHAFAMTTTTTTALTPMPENDTNVTATTAATAQRRRCFLPLFALPASGLVRACRCIDSSREAELGCRALRTLAPPPPSQHEASKSLSDYSVAPTAASVHAPPLSIREFDLAFPMMRSSAEWSSSPLPWISGESIFTRANGSVNDVARLMDRASPRRFVAGPSSTTTTLLTLARFVDLASPPCLHAVRLALIAYLVPTDDHSLLEVLAGAESKEGESNTFQPVLHQLASGIITLADLIARALLPSTSDDNVCCLTPAARTLDDTASDAADTTSSSCSHGFALPTRDALNDALSRAILHSFASPSLRSRALASSRASTSTAVSNARVRVNAMAATTTTAAAASSKPAAACSPLLDAYWRMLGIDAVTATSDADESATAKRSNARTRPTTTGACDPTAFLHWLVRTIDRA